MLLTGLPQPAAVGQQAQDPLGDGEVGAQLGGDAGAQHLDHHLLSLVGGPVHLTDRGGCQDPLVPVLEQHLGRPAILVLQDGPDVAGRQRLDGVLQLAQLLDINLRQQVGPRAEHLADLDEQGPQVLQRGADALGALPVADLREQARATEDDEAVQVAQD
jgi:hypothetical protein